MEGGLKRNHPQMIQINTDENYKNLSGFDCHVKAGLRDKFHNVRAKFSKDRVADIPTGMKDRRLDVIERAIFAEENSWISLRHVRQERNREDVPASRDEHTMNLAQGQTEVENMFQRLGGEHEIKRGVGVGQPREILRAYAHDDRPRFGPGGIIGSREVGQGGEEFVKPLDPVNLCDA
jgi:hypothetical protein